MDNKQIILAIDFDGTIVELDYPNIGKLRKNAVKYINKLYNENYLIIINSCRANKEEKEMKTFLKKNNIKFHFINENDPLRIEYFGTDTRKISANVYIDDKNLGKLLSWRKIYKKVKAKNPYK